SAAVTALSLPRLGGREIVVRFVNTVIIASILFFGISFIKPLQTEKKQGLFAIRMVVILLAIMFASQIGNRYLWNVNAFSEGKKFLFAEKYEARDGSTVYGILYPTNLWKFVVISLVISWLFITFLDIGKSKHTIDIALAIILGANAAHGGMSYCSVVNASKLIALIILTHQFSSKFGIGNAKVKWFASALVAVLLVGWISAIVMPGVGWIGCSEKEGRVSAPTTGVSVKGRSAGFWMILVLTIIIAAGIAYIIVKLIT
ncbi:hypothetical protein KY366_04765, partial [Candidatus Woesearchaeota archaeon]|nr:hypothetical protein [Candidatus Woesearchaeota archaeon]